MGYAGLQLILEHLRHRPIRVSLTVVGVAVGVSAWLSIRLANEEVLRVFHESVDSAVGRAALVIKGRSGDFDERIIAHIRQHPGVHEAIPVIAATATVLSGPSRGSQVQVVGVDLLREQAMIAMEGQGSPRRRLDALLAPDTIFVDKSVAARWNVAEGDRLTLLIRDRPIPVTVRGIVRDEAAASRVVARALVMDIATAQVLFDRIGRLDRIHLVTVSGYSLSRLLAELADIVPPSLAVSRMEQRNERVEAMIASFQLNLEVLSAVGLLIGIFLVYNTVSFSVVQHRREIGILRALGVSRAQIHTVFLGEAAVLGALGGILGVGIGYLMADMLMKLVSQSVTDLYAPVAVRAPSASPWLWGEGLIVGVGLALCGGVRPCWEAGCTDVVKALAPGDYEAVFAPQLWPVITMSLAAFALAAVCTIPGPVFDMPIFGYVSAFCVLLGCTFLAPVGLRLLCAMMNGPWRRSWSVPGTLALDHLARAPHRSSVTISALVIGLAVIVGVGTMIRSFRVAVEEWIDQTMIADLIVGAPLSRDSDVSPSTPSDLPLHLLSALERISGVEAVDPYRQVSARANGEPVTLVARNLMLHAQRSRYLFRSGRSSDLLSQAVDDSGALVSEVLARRLDVTEGDDLVLETDVGDRRMPILGVFYDYATDGGKIVIDHGLYQRWWHDDHVTVFALYLADTAQSEEIRRQIETRLAPRIPLSTIGHRELREEILQIFDRTFRATFVLEFIAVCVALLGIMNTLTIAIYERQRELATLRALGASIRHIQCIIRWESGYLAVIGAVLGLVGGLGLATVLVAVINKQSFGWTVPLHVSGGMLLEALAISGLAAMLAAYLPAKWVTKQAIVDGIRYE
ncbi:MAG: FtsX-like permease family protein [Nitrospirae bacterium]|nr:MAG: FtsX-like permease family protein [Nitrospirota bacterium]